MGGCAFHLVILDFTARLPASAGIAGAANSGVKLISPGLACALTPHFVTVKDCLHTPYQYLALLKVVAFVCCYY